MFQIRLNFGNFLHSNKLSRNVLNTLNIKKEEILVIRYVISKKNMLKLLYVTKYVTKRNKKMWNGKISFLFK